MSAARAEVPVRPASSDDRCELRAVDGGEALEAWHDAQARSFVPFDVQPARDSRAAFDARMVRRSIGSISIVDYECGRARGRRGPRQIAATERDVVGILLMRRGQLGLTLDGRSLLVSAGDAVIWDSVREGSWVALTPIAKRTLVIPRDVLRGAFPRLERVLSQRLRADTPAVRLLSDYVDTLVGLDDSLAGAAAVGAVDGAIALARGALSGELPEAPDLRTALTLEVPRYIDAHLGDLDLSPNSIARAHAVSVRTLYQAFDGTGESLAALIRRRRLERCHEELSQPGTESVTRIAARWGFRDSSTFSRAFRAHFGRSPREVRAAAAS